VSLGNGNGAFSSGGSPPSSPYSNSVSFSVYDPTPQITFVQLLDINTGAAISAVPAGGQAWAIIYGTNFGLNSGSLNICPTGANPCTTNPSDVTVTQVAWYHESGYDQVNALLTASASSAGLYDIQITSTGLSGTGLFFQAPAGRTSPQSPRGGPVPVATPSLSCPATVTRGGSINCTVANATASRVSGWQFSDGNGGTVSGTNSNNSWSGVMVVSGTISVTISGYGPLQQSVTVNPRSGWHTQAASPAKVSDGTLTWTGPDKNTYTTALPSPPLPDPWPLGVYVNSIIPSYSYVPVGSGPNQGYFYVTSITYPASSFYFQWEIANDLANAQSTFSINQCETNGYISYSNLLAGAIRHESSQVAQSHWIFYSNSLNTNNFGDWTEQQTAQPATSPSAFQTQVANGLNGLAAQINTDTGVEPYQDNYDANGNFLGYTNYAPYTSNTCN